MAKGSNGSAAPEGANETDSAAVLPAAVDSSAPAAPAPELPPVPAEAPKLKIERVAIEEAEKLRSLYIRNTGKEITLSETIAAACATVRTNVEAILKVG